MTTSLHKFGPFEFFHGPLRIINGKPSRSWTMNYGEREIAQHTIFNQNIILSELQEAFEQDRANFVDSARSEHGPMRVELVKFATDEVLASFESFEMCGMSPGLMNDSADVWLCSADRRYSRSVANQRQYASIVARYEAPEYGWITGLLPDVVLTHDAKRWEPPTDWHIRHLVGVDSLIGITGAYAAELVGISPQNFRKYTAADGAKTRQNMSFAMWHLLLHRLGVQRMPEGLGAVD